MKSVCRILSLLMALLAAGQVLGASQEIAGVWRGTLQIDPKTAITLDFVFVKKPDGQYSAVLSSPTSGAIKNVAAKSVSLQEDALKVEVPALSGTFSGTVKAGGIDGKWSQPGGSLPLALSPKPQIPKADADIILGTWTGALQPSGNFVMTFKLNDQGDITGTLAVASDQGGGEWAMEELSYASGKLFFKLPSLGGQFTASYADGALNGVWKQPGAPPSGVPVTLKKGDSAAVVRVLKLSGPAFVALSGLWTGTLTMKNPQGQEVSGSFQLGFGTNGNADIVGFIASPVYGTTPVPMSDASLEGNRFVAKVGALGAEYHGDLGGGTLKGEWVQGAQRVPLNLTRH